jgi:hypothetical protein
LIEGGIFGYPHGSFSSRIRSPRLAVLASFVLRYIAGAGVLISLSCELRRGGSDLRSAIQCLDDY